jgi:hypothetical protein
MLHEHTCPHLSCEYAPTLCFEVEKLHFYDPPFSCYSSIYYLSTTEILHYRWHIFRVLLWCSFFVFTMLLSCMFVCPPRGPAGITPIICIATMQEPTQHMTQRTNDSTRPPPSRPATIIIIIIIVTVTVTKNLFSIYYSVRA